jgi:hypothetical protein
MLDYLQARIHRAAFPADDARFRERVDVQHEWQHPVAHGSVLRARRRLMAASGRYRSRFCITRPAEVECRIRSLPLTVLHCAACGG